MRDIRISGAAAALGAALWLSGPAALAAVETVIDLGQAPAGTIDTFEVEARNQSCDEPQNFRFAPRGLPWLKLVNGSVVRGVERGKTKRFVAEIDLRGLKAGRHSGRLDVICETCGDFAGSRCHIDLKSIALSVVVVPG
jgi:hypothetical protein